MNIEISLVVPVFNTGKYLKDLFESIIIQDFSSYEVIIIDDGSIDNSVDIIRGYTEMYPRFKLYSFENAGLSVARNRGIKYSTGDFIQFVDSDDVLPLGYLSEVMSDIKKNDLDAYFGSARVIDEAGRDINDSSYVRDDSCIKSARELFVNDIENRTFIPSACLYIARREIIEKIKFYSGIYHEDNLFTVKLYASEHIKRVKRSATCIYLRRLRSGSITQEKKSEKHALGYLVVCQELFDFASSLGDKRLSDSILEYSNHMLLQAIYVNRSLGFILRVKVFVKIFIRIIETGNNFKMHIINLRYSLFGFF